MSMANENGPVSPSEDDSAVFLGIEGKDIPDVYNALVASALDLVENSKGPFSLNLASIPQAMLPDAARSVLAIMFIADEANIGYDELVGVISRVLQKFALYVMVSNNADIAESELVKRVLVLEDKNFL